MAARTFRERKKQQKGFVVFDVIFDIYTHVDNHRRPRRSMCQMNILVFIWTKYDESSKLP